MSSRVLAYINPKIMIWARKSLDLSLKDAGKKTGIAISTLTKAEQGEKHLTMKQLRKLAKVYKRSLATFYADEIPSSLEFPDFRSTEIRSTMIKSQLNPIIRDYKIKKSYAVDLYYRLSQNHDYSVLTELKNERDPERLASHIRDLLQIDHQELRKLRNHAVLNYWKEKIENLGILVFQFPRIDPEVTRGMSLASRPFPVIAINQKDSYYARVFTLIHELTHIIEKQDGLCHSASTITELNELETYCNQVASHVLVPEIQLKARVSGPINDTNIYDIIDDLSNHFKTSWTVLLIKLKDLDLISSSLFQTIKSSLMKRSMQNRSSGRGGNFYTLLFSQVSDTYMKLVKKGLHNRQLSYYESMTYLDVSYKVMEGIEAKWGEEDIS